MLSRSPVWTYSLPTALLLMAPFDILASLAMDIYLPIVPAMPGMLNTSPEVVQLTLSLYMVMLGLGQIIFGPISDRIGRRPVLIGGAILFATTSLCLAASSAAIPFVTLRFLQAVGASATLVATFATVRDVYADRSESVTIYGLFSSMLAFVPAIGPVAGALLAERFGWRSIFVTLSVLALLAILHALPRWHETRPVAAISRRSFLPILRSGAFWTYTLGFSAAMGTFFVFFSTAPRILIDRAGYSELEFSLAFATAAGVMIITARFAKLFVPKWGHSGSLLRGMAMLLLGSALLSTGQVFGMSPSLGTFVAPMWVMAIGIVFTVSVTANGALEEFGDMAGSAVAVYFCVQSLIVAIVGTLAVIWLQGDTAWPLAAYSSAMAGIVLIARGWLPSRKQT